MKNITKKTIQLFILTFFVSIALNVKAYEKEGVIEKEFKINSNTRIEFTNKSSDLRVKVWNQQAVKLECFYKLRANNQKDIEKTLDALKNLDVNQSNHLLSIKTGIFTKINSTIISGLIKKFVGTLTSGTVVRLKEYEIEYVLTLPDNHEFMLKQKYSDVNMSDYAGELELDMYDVDLRAGQTPNLKSLKAKYSDLIMERLGDCKMDIYDSDVEVEKMGNLNLKSKYSKIEIDELGTVIVDSYDDKLYFTALKSIEGKAKYTNLEIGDIKFGDLNLYDCELRAKDCGSKLKLVGKYSGIVFDKVDIFEYPDCYDNKVEADYIGEFSTNSKYTEFIFGRVSGMIDFDTYDDKLTVGQVDEDFYSISVDGKYTDVKIILSGTPQYFIDLDLKYTKYEIPKNVLYSDVNTKSRQFIAAGRTEGLRSSDNPIVKKGKNGVRKANIGKIRLVQYDGNLTIK